MAGAAVLLLFGALLPLPASGTPLLQQSPTYAQEYALYQQAQSETDAARRKQVVLDFISQFKASELDPHISYLYAQHLEGLKARSEWQSLAADGEAFLKHRPADKVIAALTTEAYQRLGQPDKLVKFGAQLYSQAPSAATAYLVAKAYLSMNDTANFRKWADRTLQHAPGNVEMLVELVSLHWKEGTLDQATGLAEKILSATKSGDPQHAAVRAFAHRALGQNAFLLGDNTTAHKHYSMAVELDPKMDFAQLQLGYICWRLGRVDDAIRCFAKAVALNGSSSKDARKELYSLLRSRYGSAENATRFIEAAKQELGIS
jgi:tetratricopeptide (TPR) repeat protein